MRVMFGKFAEKLVKSLSETLEIYLEICSELNLFGKILFTFVFIVAFPAVLLILLGSK